ncbi:MAG: hypothetical protein UZ20_WS6002000283 [candidate division WS6 bacterium OLB21]|uniref:Uncharacterized protein n=1 Tax=candidate division WS6 bacterium OLB21 TaxID=1617427 RepID=A0A136KJU6_9BACT|nr:MAG: hypothetical protein UZ20_WS6002000283 [candidate division WS6 bacterium OLB21]
MQETTQTALGLPNRKVTGPLNPLTTSANGDSHSDPTPLQDRETRQIVPAYPSIDNILTYLYLEERLATHGLSSDRIAQIQERISGVLGNQGSVNIIIGDALRNPSIRPILMTGIEAFDKAMPVFLAPFFEHPDSTLTFSIQHPSEALNDLAAIGSERYRVFALAKGWNIPSLHGENQHSVDVDPNDLASYHVKVINKHEDILGSMRIVWCEKPQPSKTLEDILDSSSFLVFNAISDRGEVINKTIEACQHIEGLETAIIEGRLVTFERLIGANYEDIYGENSNINYRNGTLAIMGVLTLLTSAWLLEKGMDMAIIQADRLNSGIYEENFRGALHLIHNHSEMKYKHGKVIQDETNTYILDLKKARDLILTNMDTLSGFAKYALNLVREP